MSQSAGAKAGIGDGSLNIGSNGVGNFGLDANSTVLVTNGSTTFVLELTDKMDAMLEFEQQ